MTFGTVQLTFMPIVTLRAGMGFGALIRDWQNWRGCRAVSKRPASTCLLNVLLSPLIRVKRREKNRPEIPKVRTVWEGKKDLPRPSKVVIGGNTETYGASGGGAKTVRSTSVPGREIPPGVGVCPALQADKEPWPRGQDSRLWIRIRGFESSRLCMSVCSGAWIASKDRPRKTVTSCYSFPINGRIRTRYLTHKPRCYG